MLLGTGTAGIVSSCLICHCTEDASCTAALNPIVLVAFSTTTPDGEVPVLVVVMVVFAMVAFTACTGKVNAL